MPSTSSAPLLPHDFLQLVKSDPMMVGFKSTVFSTTFHKERLLMIDANSEDRLHPDHPMTLPVGGPLTYLETAASVGDPLLACEMIRLGANPDFKNASGSTALFLALDSYEKVKTVRLLGLAEVPRKLEHIIPRLAFVAARLIEQHADLNVSVKGLTPLHKACAVRDWDLISLLLEHGAHFTPSTTHASTARHPMTFLPTREDQSRYLDLVRSFPPGKPRPPRMCPCFSQKTLDQCHRKGQKPYPPDFACICASGKTYATCCSRRRVKVVEEWVNFRIRTLFIRDVRLDTSSLSEEKANKIDGNIRSVAETYEAFGIPFTVPEPLKLIAEAHERVKKMADDLCDQGLIDPAYRFAVNQLDYMPRPQGRKLNKRRCQELQMEWNATVDKYIALGLDKRPRADIERAAKIGASNGALYRVCEGTSCSKLEGRDIDTIQKCSKCKMAVYCSEMCQRSAWRTHKKKCLAEDQYEQELPSQALLFKRVMSSELEGIATMNLTPPPEIRMLLDAVRSKAAP